MKHNFKKIICLLICTLFISTLLPITVSADTGSQKSPPDPVPGEDGHPGSGADSVPAGSRASGCACGRDPGAGQAADPVRCTK